MSRPTTFFDIRDLMSRIEETMRAVKSHAYIELPRAGSEVIMVRHDEDGYERAVDCALEPWFGAWSRLRDELDSIGLPPDARVELNTLVASPMFVLTRVFDGRMVELSWLSVAREDDIAMLSIGRRRVGWRRSTHTTKLDQPFPAFAERMAQGLIDPFGPERPCAEEAIEAIEDELAGAYPPIVWFKAADPAPFTHASVTLADSAAESRRCLHRVAAHFATRLGEPNRDARDDRRGAWWPRAGGALAIWEGTVRRRAEGVVHPIKLGLWEEGTPAALPPDTSKWEPHRRPRPAW